MRQSHKTIIHVICIVLLSVLAVYIVDPQLTKLKYSWPLLPALFLAGYHKWLLRIAVFVLLLFALYSPIGLTYGRLTLAMLASAMETNINEGSEFLANIRGTHYLFALAYLALTALYYLTATVRKPRKKALYAVLVPLFLYTLLTSWPGTLIRDAVRHNIRYVENHRLLTESLNKPDRWQITATDQGERYPNYLLIIGESARKDYFSAYGYPHPTTPWLDQQPGVFLDGMIAKGANTIAALSRTLALLDASGNPIPENNIITLANKAGYDTYWLSNQGRLGKFDTSTSSVAIRADHSTFLNKGTWDDSNLDDMVLLDELAEVLNQPQATPTPRLIVLHMFGSHPNVCQHLHDFPRHFSLKQGEALDCYLTSIEKTDAFIHHATDLLAKQGRYSLLYFSDHGISVTTQGASHSDDIRNNYEVPLILLDSDAEAHQVVQKALSGAHFIDLFARWIGVETTDTSTQFDLRRPEQIPTDAQIRVYQHDQLIDPANLPREPVLH